MTPPASPANPSRHYRRREARSCQSAAVNMAPIALNWALESDPTGQPVGPRNHPAARQERVSCNLSSMPDDRGTAYHLEPVGQWIRRPVHRTRRPGLTDTISPSRPGDARAARLHRHAGAGVDFSAHAMAVVPDRRAGAKHDRGRHHGRHAPHHLTPDRGRAALGQYPQGHRRP